jgi:hypothetical protein
LKIVTTTTVAKHDYWLAFLNSPLKCFIIEERVVSIHPDNEQLSVELLDESMPDDEEHCELHLLTIVSTTISNLYKIQRKSSGMEVEDLFDN